MHIIMNYKVLNYMQTHIPDAEMVFVNGGSAGGSIVPYVSPIIAQVWPQARVKALADSGLFFLPHSSAHLQFFERNHWKFPNE